MRSISKHYDQYVLRNNNKDVLYCIYYYIEVSKIYYVQNFKHSFKQG